MPRADPTRSAYCASRHLLRNLDDAAELRRNPLVRACFAPPPAQRDAAANHRALDSVRGLVHASLVRCRERPHPSRARVDLGRMHAALLRCEIDKQPLAVVAAELGLSDRQVRRERRAAHDAFLDAFNDAASGAAPAAVVRDKATLRLAEAVELHELGQSALAMSVYEDVAASAPQPEQRIEALCLAAEVDLDAARHAAASAHAAEASAILALRAHELDEDARALAVERIDFATWSLRRASGVSGGLGTPPPLIVARTVHDDYGAHDEPRRALLTRALAGYASQRWDVGDGGGCRAAVLRAQALLPTLDPSRAKERLAVMYADAQFYGLRSIGGDHDRFLAIERLAAQRRYARTMLSARAERIGTHVSIAQQGEGVFEEILRPFETGNPRTMPGALATAARIAAQCEEHPRRTVAAAQLAERLAAPRSPTAMFARCMRATVAFEHRRYDEAAALVHAVRADAELLGNARLRGAAARRLGEIAYAQRRRGDALRHAGEALALLEQYGTHASLADAKDLARRLGID